MNITTKNYYQKKLASFFFTERMYDNLRIYKSIVSMKLGKNSDPIFKTLKYFLNDGDSVLDIGANIGQSAIYFSPYVGKNGKIYSIEPVGNNYRSLIRMKKIMKLNNVIPINNAISNKEGKENIMIPLLNKKMIVGTQAVLESNKKTPFENYVMEVVEKITIDILAKKYDLTKLKLIKCDTEGAEINVIKGGLQTIEKYKPMIVLEISLKDPNLNLLYNLGYQPFHFNGEKLVSAVNSDLRQDPIFIHDSQLNTSGEGIDIIS